MKFLIYGYVVNIGLVTVISALLTLIVTKIIKLILIKKKIIHEDMDETEKDQKLSRIGRVVAVVIYSGLYLCTELYLKHELYFDKDFFFAILLGASLTLAVAKSVYSFFHQWSKKKNIYERLAYAEQLLKEYEKHDSNSIVLTNKKDK